MIEKRGIKYYTIGFVRGPLSGWHRGDMVKCGPYFFKITHVDRKKSQLISKQSKKVYIIMDCK